ncbi:hypothetical protein Aperf_G00000116270 [Anoplocephala perfoliata]
MQRIRSSSDIQERSVRVSNGDTKSLRSSSSSSDSRNTLESPNYSTHSSKSSYSSSTPEQTPTTECCCGVSTGMIEGQSVEIETTQSQANAKFDKTHPNYCSTSSLISTGGRLGPVCSVPMLPDFEKMLGFKNSFVISVETQTSPMHSSPSYNGSSSHSPSSDGGRCIPSSYSRKRVTQRKCRSLGESLMALLRKKFCQLRYFLKPHASGYYCVENPLNAVGVDFQSNCSPSNGIGSVRVSMLCAFEGGSYLVQLRRDCSCQPFGVYFRSDAHGLYISRTAKRVELRSSEDYLKVNARVLDVQGVPAEMLDSDGIRELAKGCLVLTLKLRPAVFQ